MRRIVVFGAGGNAGRRAVAQAVARGHRVTAVVREPARYPELAGPSVSVVAGDVTDPTSVATVSAGHDAVVSTVYRAGLPSVEFYSAATRALVTGLAQAGVGRLVVVGLGTVLETAPGVPVHDTPGFPVEAREFSLGHAAGLELLRDCDTELDWVVLAPPPAYLDAEATGTGSYRTGGTAVLAAPNDAPLFAYADLVTAVLDEIDTPKHHRVLVAVGHA